MPARAAPLPLPLAQIPPITELCAVTPEKGSVAVHLRFAKASGWRQMTEKLHDRPNLLIAEGSYSTRRPGRCWDDGDLIGAAVTREMFVENPEMFRVRFECHYSCSAIFLNPKQARVANVRP